MTEYEACIGMECHAELLTESKMFCGCRNEFGGEPNTRCCPVCTGMPGSLPVANRQAVEHVIRAALALNCEINPKAKFDRKNYFYPDLPKGYQISEYDEPIGRNGYLDIEVNGEIKRVRIRRVHLEEDTGKLFHMPGNESYIDLNRSGVPLMEIVTDFPPDIHTPEEARAYLVKLRAILTYIGVCDGKMEQGSLRCEPNVSVRVKGTKEYGTKTEIKNLNSFRSVQKGIEYEIARQIALLERGERVVQETRGWNEARQATFPQRSKEVEQEYRYFPDPDLVPLQITPEWIEAIKATMPELPDVKKARFMREYGLSDYDASYLTETRALADYFEETAKHAGDAKAAANWIMGDLSRLLNAEGKEIDACPITPQQLGSMIRMIADGTISGKIAKTLIEYMYQSGEDPDKIAAREGLITLRDESAIRQMVQQVFTENPKIVADILEKGLVQKKGFLVGQVMKLSQGKADPKEVNRLIDEILAAEQKVR
ncbi:MAG TPA: Asp-tRNA(Asn)/Glu-tRNA(Gln) amidotransferase subunit GatB [Chthonomonas sp.]|uniref:Asp-tRNA(Asn)/Glu-tRNA(Gln) amidotransferase subunit GatB n=1 Tax=Chthonomonas sp. TaxID=2282153 RepID=UPI002B4ABA15|nr:Asp-tRNA(Asn)/Glu-tRNA(Gln) amidotransferase subunit GatB [Chthonomonas sp.]HLI48869.1 Asp-tRNA(Asn)/Glu-tRNA(Gln) amidotransferase subunit GatB [Chthonomonas sp.]